MGATRTGYDRERRRRRRAPARSTAPLSVEVSSVEQFSSPIGQGFDELVGA